jgi:hypothetical protein
VSPRAGAARRERERDQRAPAERGHGDEAPGLEELGGQTLIVDRIAGLAPGQMSKSEFMSRVRAAVFAAAEEGLAPAGFSARDCPYIRFWTAFYRYRDAAHVQRAVLKYAPEAVRAHSAEDFIPLIAARVRRAVDHWSATRELRNLPEGLPTFALRDDLVRAPEAPVEPGLAPDVGDPGAVRMELGPGSALESGVRQRMESLFHEDFSAVRVHTGEPAVTMARLLRARAFTVGSDIAFAHQQYRPGLPVGDAVLAHELAHVIQQRHGRSAPVGDAVEAPGTALEQEADQAAAGALSAAPGLGVRLSTITARIRPALRTGLRIQRCQGNPPSSTPARGPLAFASSAFTPSVSGALAISDPGGAAAHIESRPYTASGTVAASGGTDAQAADWEAGFMQTVRTSRRLDYHDGSGHWRYLRISFPTGWVRDGDAGVTPWYGAETVRPFTTTNSSVTPAMGDTPQMDVPWTLADGAETGNLTASDGKDEFCSWMVVQQKSTGAIQYLNWDTWEVDWTATYNPVARTGSGTGTGSRVIAQGAGQGAVTPLTGDPVANDAVNDPGAITVTP